jgi:hypothetical protein
LILLITTLKDCICVTKALVWTHGLGAYLYSNSEIDSKHSKTGAGTGSDPSKDTGTDVGDGTVTGTNSDTDRVIGPTEETPDTLVTTLTQLTGISW